MTLDPHIAPMREAIRLSIENVDQGRGGPFGAVIVKDGRIVARGTNLVTANHDPTAHAEIVAIRLACEALGTFQLAGCEVYCSCEPCPMCLGALYWARPDAIWYACTKDDAAAIGFDDAFLYEELARPAGERERLARQILRDEALVAFEKWKASTTRVDY